MEGNVQRIFAIMIAVIIFFLLPMYIAFEKKDDISYALALKITSNFVDSVAQKGYLSRDMYDQYITDLSASDNVYDISVEHVSRRYYPVIYVYSDNDHTTIVDKLDYALYTTQYNAGSITIGSKKYDSKKLALAYDLVEEKYNLSQIEKILDQNLNNSTQKAVYKDMSDAAYKALNVNSIPVNPNMYGTATHTIYTMNEGDTFTVTIRNENVTVATVLFNALTFGANAGNTTKVYINYGSTIKNEEYKVNNSVNQ